MFHSLVRYDHNLPVRCSLPLTTIPLVDAVALPLFILIYVRLLVHVMQFDVQPCTPFTCSSLLHCRRAQTLSFSTNLFEMSIAVYSQLRFILTLCQFISQTKDDPCCHSSVKQRAALELHKDIVHMNQQENANKDTP